MAIDLFSQDTRHSWDQILCEERRFVNLFDKILPAPEISHRTAEGKSHVGKIVIVGNPNVGKSVIFNNLTGGYVTVSNYPGTTVEIARGLGKIGKARYEVIDTPGMYSLLPITEEERVARKIILVEKPDVVLHVIDAKNLERMLVFTLQLIEAGLPVVLVLNIMDEAEKMGLNINIQKLEDDLNIPVVPTVSITKQGMARLKHKILDYTPGKMACLKYDDRTEEDIGKLESLLEVQYLISKRAISLLLLQNDTEITDFISKREPEPWKIKSLLLSLKKKERRPVNFTLNQVRQRFASGITDGAISVEDKYHNDFAEKLSGITMNPWTGVPILFFVLYFGLYKFVGQLGAGTIVNFFENVVFDRYINPDLIKLTQSVIPWEILQQLFIGEYGIFTLGIRYAVAIILPIVGMFFIVFSIIEDTGYLPRLAMLIDRIFKKIGLSGRAVIPMVLGLGCDTMATVTTRTLSTNRERILATLLLALAVPCSAQLGVILSLFENNPKGLLVWLSVIILTFLLVGYLGAKLMPGKASVFFMEVPPLRLPKLFNITVKTYTRMTWYFKEIFPLFIFASFCIWVGQVTGLFDMTIALLKYPVRLLDLPDGTSVVFLFGFFRRDYGAAGLYDMNRAGLLSGNQLVVASVTMTLFLPCIAQFLINIKERGWKTGIGISVFVLFFSCVVGFILNLVLKFFKISL